MSLVKPVEYEDAIPAVRAVYDRVPVDAAFVPKH